VQLSPLLYRVAELCDGRRDLREMAQEVSRSCGRGVSADNVRFLIEKKLAPLGIASLDEADTASVAVDRPNLLLALRFRIKLMPERAVNAIARILHPLFSPVVVRAVLGSLVALDVWLFFEHGIGGGIRQSLYDPSLMLMVLGLLLVSAVFHECGHATGCSYGGARPGGHRRGALSRVARLLRRGHQLVPPRKAGQTQSRSGRRLLSASSSRWGSPALTS
jgi:putative peptide zinc metalloprotease protein